MKNIKPWKTLKSEYALNNKWFKVRKDTVELPSGRVVDDYFYSESGAVVMIFAITPEQKVIWVRQYKHGAKKVVNELPAGFVDDKETIEGAARRELLEETGYQAKDIIELGFAYNSPTKTTLKVHFFLAQNVVKANEPISSDNEEIEVLEVPITETAKLISSGEICASDSIACAFLALNKLSK